MIYKIFILQELSTLVEDIEEKVRSNTADLEVRKTQISFAKLVRTLFFSNSRS